VAYSTYYAYTLKHTSGHESARQAQRC
jgi:hypothetical protein